MIDVTWESLPLILLTITVAVLGVARLTVVVVYDDFPPTQWWREHWDAWTAGTGWEPLFSCWWCFAFWASLACIGTWILGLFFLWAAWFWWIFWGALALAYVAPMIIVRDGRD